MTEETNIQKDEAPVQIITDLDLLRTKSTDVDAKEFSDTVVALKKAFQDHREKAVGLSAPQINIFKRAFIAKLKSAENTSVPDGVLIFINPTITVSGEIRSSTEGCLSIPGVQKTLGRYNTVHVSAHQIIDLADNTYSSFTISGDDAIVLQHENDHLNGKLIIDHFDVTDARVKSWKRSNNRLTRVKNNRMIKKANQKVVKEKISDKRLKKIEAERKSYLRQQKKCVEIKTHFEANSQGW